MTTRSSGCPSRWAIHSDPIAHARSPSPSDRNLEKNVDSGRLTLVDEKRALAEISSLKKTRKTVESFATQQAAIDADKAKIDEVRAALDDPEAKSISDKFNAARQELDTINKAHDEASKGRDALFEERNASESSWVVMQGPGADSKLPCSLKGARRRLRQEEAVGHRLPRRQRQVLCVVNRPPLLLLLSADPTQHSQTKR